MPIKKARYRYRTISSTKRQRLAFKNNRAVEVTGYTKRNGKWVKTYTRRKPRR